MDHVRRIQLDWGHELNNLQMVKRFYDCLLQDRRKTNFHQFAVPFYPFRIEY